MRGLGKWGFQGGDTFEREGKIELIRSMHLLLEILVCGDIWRFGIIFGLIRWFAVNMMS